MPHPFPISWSYFAKKLLSASPQHLHHSILKKKKACFLSEDSGILDSICGLTIQRIGMSSLCVCDVLEPPTLGYVSPAPSKIGRL